MEGNDVLSHFASGIAAIENGDPEASITQMRNALKLDPRYQPAIQWLAFLYAQTGDYEQAEKFAHRALLADPNNFEGLLALGLCRAAQRDLLSALRMFDMAGLTRPDDIRLHLARGRALRGAFRLNEAVRSLQRAADLSQDPDLFVEVGELLTAMGRRDDSITAFSAALIIRPDSLAANVLMARALTDLDRLDEAERYWAQSEKLEESAGQARLAKALAFALSGRFREAEKEASASIELNPIRGKPYHVLFSSKRAQFDDKPTIARMEDLLKRIDVCESDQVDLLYALGKAYDDLGEYEIAIRRFDAANALLRKLTFGDRQFDRGGFRGLVDRQIQMFSANTLRFDGETEVQLPLFVMGMVRSGTTLVDQILSCHPEIGSAGEQGFWLQNEEVVVDYGRKVTHDKAADRLRADYCDLLSSLAPNSRHVIDKNPANVLVAGLIHTLYPASRIICTRRNAVDTVLSIWMTQMQTHAPFVFDRSDIVFAYKEFLRLTDHWRDSMPECRYREIRYESLVEELEPNARVLVDFCGLEWHERCLKPELNTRSIRTPSFWQVRQPVYKTSIGRWRHYERWLGPFEELMGL